MKKKWLQVFFVPMVLTAMLFASCGSSSGDKGAMNETSAIASPSTGGNYASSTVTAKDQMAEADMAEVPNAGSTNDIPGEGVSSVLQSQKIIQTLNYKYETLNFEDSIKAIETLCSELGGFVENSSQGGRSLGDNSQLRYADYTLRIPQDKLSTFKSNETRIGTMVQSSTSTDNVTREYFDTESRIKSLRMQEERLLAILEKSGDLADIIELEQVLSEVCYEIESLTTSLQHLDDLANFSTINISLSEVAEVTVEKAVARTLPQKIFSQLSESTQRLGDFGAGLLVLVLGNSPIFLLLGGLFCAIYFPLRHQNKKRMKLHQAPEKKDPPKSE